MGKLFFFDIDGTLTGVEKPGHIYESTREAIRQLKANGHFVALATGRAAFRARMFQEEIGIENMICEGGNQLIMDWETVEYTPIDQNIAKTICEKALANDFGIAISTSDTRVRFTPNHRFIEQAGDFHDFMDVVVDETFDYQQAGVIRRLFLTIPKGKEDLIPEIDQIGRMHYGDDQFIIVEPDHKYTGIAKMCKLLGKDEKDVVVFGDGLNDRKMFEKAPFSIAMGNAIDELKEMADYICEDSDHDGIYLACKHFGWI